MTGVLTNVNVHADEDTVGEIDLEARELKFDNSGLSKWFYKLPGLCVSPSAIPKSWGVASR